MGQVRKTLNTKITIPFYRTMRTIAKLIDNGRMKNLNI